MAPYDEIWFDPASSDMYLRNVPFRSYMWARSSYFISSFFRLAAAVSDPAHRATTRIARFSAAALRDLLRTRLSQALGTAMTGLTSVAALPNLQSTTTQSKRVGFVGIGLDKVTGERFIEGIRISEGLVGEDDDDDDLN